MTPLRDIDDPLGPEPPSIAPPLRNAQEDTTRQHRDAVTKRRARTDDASFPLISFNWSDNLSSNLPDCAQKYLNGVDRDCSVGDLRDIAHLGDNLHRMSGEVRVDARHIQGTPLGARDKLVSKLDDVGKSIRFWLQKFRIITLEV